MVTKGGGEGMALCANDGFMRVDIHLGLALDPNEHWCGLGGSPKEPGDSIRFQGYGKERRELQHSKLL